MSKFTMDLISSLLLCSVVPIAAQAQSAITEQEAQSIAADAYVYLYPNPQAADEC
jgi:hypothetical protein